MNIIVTGGAGFIRSNFVFHMLNTYPDYRIICVDKLTYAGNLSTLEPVMDNPNSVFAKSTFATEMQFTDFSRKNILTWLLTLQQKVM